MSLLPICWNALILQVIRAKSMIENSLLLISGSLLCLLCIVENSVYFFQGRSSDEDDDGGLDGITFAPHDVCPISFIAKDNVHGLGYRGIDPTAALFHGNRMEPIPVRSKGRLGIRGQVIPIRS